MLSSSDIQGLLYDPTRIQKTILDVMGNNTNGITITDPNNPFLMLLEASVMTSANGALEATNLIRKTHPSLAITPDELYKHLSDEEITNMFATPTTAIMTFQINTVDLRNNGFKATGSNYTETTIPKYTEVVVMNTTFTLLNDIIVRYYDEGRVYVESLYNDMEISFNDIGIIPAGFTSDNDGGSWIIFEVPMRQIKRLKHNATVIQGDKFKYQQELTEQYYYSIATYSNSSTGNLPVKLKKSLNEEYINPLSPCITINIMGKDVLYKIPDVYNLSLNVNGSLVIETFETKGLVDLPINKYPITEYKIIRPEEAPDNESKASWNNVVAACSSRNAVSGGRNTMSLEDIRKSIVYKTTGLNELPITRHQLDKRVSFDGFNLFKAQDILLERSFIASRNLGELDSALLNARQDIFFNTVKLEMNILKNSKFIYLKDDIFIIKANTIFKEENGVVDIISNDEDSFINRLSDIEKISYFRDRQYFLTPYYYIINKEENNTKCRVYNLDTPSVSNIKIVTKNTAVKQSINLNQYRIDKIHSGYRLTFNMLGNEDYKLLDNSKLQGQLSIPLKGNDVKIYFSSNYDYNAETELTQYLTFDIDTSLFIDSDNYLEVSNGISSIRNNFINILSTATIHLYTFDTSLRDETNYLVSEIVNNSNNKFVVLTKQTLDITFGDELKYIHNKMFTTYTDRKYLKHSVGVPMTYAEDVYERDPVTGRIFTCDAEHNIVYNITHKRGDSVVDSNGNIVYKYKKGDVVLDANNQPVIDLDAGVVRYLDIFMFEYIYYVANTNPHINYRQVCLDTVNTWLLNNIKDINSRLLDNTIVSFKSYKSCKSIQLIANNVVYAIPYIVKPVVTLYTSKLNYTAEETILIKNNIGKILHRHLDSDIIVLDNIKTEIKSILDSNIAGVKISNLDNLGNLETIVLSDKSTRLSINKYLDLTKDNKLIVNYDIDLKLVEM